MGRRAGRKEAVARLGLLHWEGYGPMVHRKGEREWGFMVLGVPRLSPPSIADQSSPRGALGTASALVYSSVSF
jgi:hypothetical protein